MLQTMRHLAHTKVFKGLMMLLMVSFAMWGIGDIFRGNPLERTVAKAGSVSISVQALNRGFEESLIKARQIFGPDLTPEKAKQLGILDKTLDTMIQRAEIDQAIKKLNIDVNQKAILDEVASQPQFRDKDGKFNKALFLRLLEQAHLNETTFINEGRQDLERHQVIDVFSTKSKLPPTILDAIYKARAQKRILDILTLKNDSVTGIPTPDDKILKDYYEKNAKNFSAPEYRSVTIAKLSTDDVAKDISISDDQLKAEYDSKGEQLAEPEKRDILQVVLQDEAKAKQILSAAKTSGNLSTAAKDAGYTAIALNNTTEKTLLAELATPVFSLKAGEVGGPYKSYLGYHVVQVKKITPPGKPEFADVKDKLKETMQKDQAIEATTRMVNQLDDQLAAGHALDDIADSLKMRLVKIPAVDATGLTPDAKAPPELPNKEDVLKTAFGQGGGETSSIMDDKNGNYLVVRTEDVTPSAPIPFDKVKPQVEASWKSEEAAKKAATEAEKIAKDLREGKPVSSFAGQKGVEVKTSKPISELGDTDASLPEAALPQIYKMKKGEVLTTTGPGEQVILHLSSFIEADPKADDARKAKLSDELETNLPTELTEEYLKYLHIVFPVEINQDALDSVRQQGG